MSAIQLSSRTSDSSMPQTMARTSPPRASTTKAWRGRMVLSVVMYAPQTYVKFSGLMHTSASSAWVASSCRSSARLG